MSGQPPGTPIAWAALMYTESTSGRSSRSTLMLTKSVVHQRGDLSVLEQLVSHHVAPVACAVPDRQQHGPVVAARALECRVSPRVPVHRVSGVLQQVWTGLGGEAIGHAATLAEALSPASQAERRRGTSRVMPNSAARDATSVIAPIPIHRQTSWAS